MPTSSQSSNPLSRIFKDDPFRDLFQLLADSLDDAVLVISGDGERILTCNHEFLLLTGYARPDLEKLVPSNLIPGEAGQHALGRMLGSRPGAGVELLDIPLQTHADRISLIDILALPMGPPHHALLLRVRPASERIQQAEMKRAEQDRLRNLIHISDLILDESIDSLPSALDLARRLLLASNVGLYRVSAASPNYILDGELPEVFPDVLPSSALTPIHKTTVWMLGQRPEHELHKASRTAGFKIMRTALIGLETAWVGILVVGWRDEAAVPPDAEALMNLVANLSHAAILLSLQRANVAQSEKLAAQLEAESLGQFEAVSDTLIVLDDELQILRANPAILRLLGYHPHELQGLQVQDVLVGPEDIAATLLDAQVHEREAERSRITLHRRDGTPIPVFLRAAPIQGKDFSGLLITIRDLSEQQALENQTEVLAQRALLGEVMAIFAHEVRNPINNITTGVQFAASKLGHDHPLFESLEQVKQECKRLDQLMSDVLFFARPLELKIEPLQLEQLIDRILSRWKPRLAQADIQCHISYPDDLPPASADPRSLEQVIVNLITNALQAMEDGGTLSATISVVESTQGQMVELKLADTGPGIPANILDRIFDPFFTTKKDGTGLGLAISRRIMNTHKGNIQVESYPDAGTVFTLTLPVSNVSTQGE
ncbi:MAG: ATP-binding protein [Anaerolineales bacterium]